MTTVQVGTELPPLDHETLSGLQRIYDESIRFHVHHRW